MLISRTSYALTLALFLLPVSCARKAVYAPDQSQQLKVVQSLAVAGLWSQPSNGLRCRILLDRDAAGETSDLVAAFEVENVSSQPIELSSPPSPNSSPATGTHTQWRAGGQPMNVDGQFPTLAPDQILRLAPGQVFVAGPVSLLIPPGPGLRQIDALLPTSIATLQAPAMPLNVTGAEWGEPADGARLRLSSARPSYTAGDPLLLRAFIQNLDREVLVLHPPHWSTMDIDTPRQRLIMQVKTADAVCTDVARGQVWWAQVPGLPLLAPGQYKLRLEIDSPELPLPNRPAWHGKLISNEVVVEVVAR